MSRIKVGPRSGGNRSEPGSLLTKERLQSGAKPTGLQALAGDDLRTARAIICGRLA
jgi:hypothetical protein